MPPPRRLVPRPRHLACALLAVLSALGGAPARAQRTTGSIEGRVLSDDSGRPLAGVTVTVQGPALPGTQTEVTDRDGRYAASGLPPGADYVLKFFYADTSVERPGIEVVASKSLAISVRMPAVTPRVLKVVERSPSIDVAGAASSVTINDDLVRNTPVRGRTYESILTLAPGATTDPVGLSFGGGTGPENGFLIDGLNTTNPTYGLMGTHLSLAFIKQTEVITGGYGAEFGRATGGLVNVVTRSGSNEVHGSAWFNYAPLSLAPTTVARLGEAIATTRRGGSGADALNFLDHAADFGFDVGGPLVKDRLWLYLGFAPTFYDQTYDRAIRTRVAGSEAEARQGGALDRSVQCPAYLRAQDPALCAPSSSAAALTAPTDPGYTRHFQSTSRLYNYIVKLNLRVTDDHRLTLTYVGSPSTFSGVFNNPRNPASLAVDFNADPAILPFDNDIQVHDVVVHLASRLLGRRLLLDASAGLHYEHSSTVPSTAGASGASVLDTRQGSLSRYEDIAPCRPTTYGATAFDPCPVSNYQYGGFGPISDTESYRVTAAVGLTWLLHGAGTHALKVGGDVQYQALRDHESYSGGAAGGRFIVNPDGSVSRRQYGALGPGGAVTLLGSDDPALSGFTARVSTVDYSLYLRDSWTVSMLPGLTVNAGLRWDAQELRDASGATQIGIYDNLAPRVGVAYDFLGNGRSKFHASYGRYYEAIPLDLNNRQFGGAGLAIQRVPSGACPQSAAGKVDVSGCGFPAPQPADLFAGSGVVAPGLKGQYTNEVIAGVQWDVGWDVVLGATYIHREIGRIIDDVYPDGAHYIIANPGEGTDGGAVSDLQKQIGALDSRLGGAVDGPARDALVQQRDALKQRLSLYQGAATFQKPRRDYNALQLTASRRLTDNFIVLASYTYSRTLGNYPGLYNPTTGQLNPNSSIQYDLRELLVNASGPLPQDHPHNLKVAAAYAIPLGAHGTLTVGANFTMVSGSPIDVLGSHPFYGPSETFILPRGAGGRTPTITQLDLHLGWSRRLGQLLRADLTADVFNVLDQQEVTAVDQQYTADAVNPIPNGTYADLRSLKNVAGTAPQLNPNFGQPIAYQAPLSMRFGVRLAF